MEKTSGKMVQKCQSCREKSFQTFIIKRSPLMNSHAQFIIGDFGGAGSQSLYVSKSVEDYEDFEGDSVLGRRYPN
ncbi:hypothetical protein OUZ56_021882 [Daphnia magna]|uniref:Uncharacterized protein n=1 Tax=Daphnia magna TaxID=35525 RepID=A0ABR0AUR6_9CRUS|nr:hypothetical protein OUZ56_021882 [Daphnia magna]